MAKRRGRRKHPKGAEGLGGKPKIPRQEPAPDPRAQYPVWQVSSIEWDPPWGWRAVNLPTAGKIHERLSNFESMTWHEILGRHSHEISTRRISSAAQRRLRELELDDVELVVSLRVSGRERIWGILDRNIFRALWWDPNHEVYPVEKRNT